MGKIKPLLCAFTLLVLTGCFDIEQNLVVNADNTAVYEAKIILSAELVSLVALAGEGDVCSDADMSQLVNIKPLKGIRVDHQSGIEGNDVVCKYIVSGPLERFSEVIINDEGSGGLIEVYKLNNIAHRIASDFGGINDEADAQLDGMTQGMMSAFFADRELRWTVTAPEIIDSNGRVNDDKTTVTWAMPLITALSDPYADLMFYADIRTKQHGGLKRAWLRIQSLWTEEADMKAKLQGYANAADKERVMEALMVEKIVRKAERFNRRSAP